MLIRWGCMLILTLGTSPALARTMQFASLMIGDVNRTRNVVEYAAGKATNVARAARTMGHDVLTLGLQGGPRGRMLLDALDAEGIAHAFVETRSPTRLCTTVIDARNGTATELIEESPDVCPSDGESLLAMLRAKLSRDDVLVLSGSLARGLAPDFIGRCVRVAHEVGARTIVDTSAEALQTAVRERPDVVKINVGELAGVVPGELHASMRSLQATFAGTLIVTGGAGPTLALRGHHWLEAVPPRVQVVSPIGCGDCFAAGVALGVARGDDLRSWLRHGTALAGANAETTRSAVFERARAEALFVEVVVRDYTPAS
jgi:tagatose 6-phosphate kinase